MIYDFSKYKFFYVNGCSFTEGGGLEEKSISEYSVISIYKNLYNIEWNNRTEVNYGKRLEEIIGIKCINDAKCGAGLDRVVRTTYDFIYNNWKDKDKFFIILEKPDSSRSDVYYNKKNKYYIVNSDIKNKKDFVFRNATVEYYNKKYSKNEEDIKNFQIWFKNHFNFEEKVLQDEKQFIGLYSFCKLNGIKIFVMESNTILFRECFHKNDIIKFTNNDSFDTINNWCFDNKFTIAQELQNLSYDSHPGYFGHIEYAKLLSKFLGYTGKFPEWPKYEIYKNKINIEKKLI